MRENSSVAYGEVTLWRMSNVQCLMAGPIGAFRVRSGAAVCLIERVAYLVSSSEFHPSCFYEPNCCITTNLNIPVEVQMVVSK